MKTRTLNLIRTGITLLGAMAVLSASGSRADEPSSTTPLPAPLDSRSKTPVMIPAFPDLQPTVNPNGNVGLLDWVFINGQPNLRIWIRNNGNVMAPPSLVGISFINPTKTINIVATIPAIPAQTTVWRLISAPFTNIGPGPALAIHADAINNMVQEFNESNNDLYFYMPKLEPMPTRN